jgi:hypothetical protein
MVRFDPAAGLRRGGIIYCAVYVLLDSKYWLPASRWILIRLPNKIYVRGIGLVRNKAPQCSHKEKSPRVNISFSDSDFEDLSAMSSTRYAFASSIVIGGNSRFSRTIACSSLGRRLFSTSFVAAAQSLHQSSLCGGTFAVEMMRRLGSMRKSARIFRWPGLDRSASENGETRCWRVFGKVNNRPIRHDTQPRSWVICS